MISFISKGWGGSTSDKYITEHNTFLADRQHGDLILADRGLNVSEAVSLFNEELKIPAFTKGKSHLCPLDVENTRKIAHSRIHVKRFIRVVQS